ncbi:hypothetical protein Tco_0503425 [Tanacetum coccineum]
MGPQKQKSRRKQKKEAEVSQDETTHEEHITTETHVSTPSYDLPPSGEDRMQLTELMILCTNLQKQVLDLEKAKDAQAKEIASLKKRVQKLEKRKKSRATSLKRLRKVDETRRVEFFEDKESLGRMNDEGMLGVNDLHGEEVIADVAAGEKEDHSAKVDEMEVSTGVEDSTAPTIPVTTTASTLQISKDELSLA